MDFEKLVALLEALGDQKVDYVLVGAVGLTVHGIVRATQDVDLFVRPEAENIARLRAAFRSDFPRRSLVPGLRNSVFAGATLQYRDKTEFRRRGTVFGWCRVDSRLAAR